MSRYNPAEIEPKWQNFWAENKTFSHARNARWREALRAWTCFRTRAARGCMWAIRKATRRPISSADIARMQGKTVLHPMGFDAFGLPAEEHAIKTNVPPRVSTENNIAEFTRQLKMLGFSYDWDRVLATTDVEYFRWTQWIFLLLFDTWIRC